MDFNKKIKAYHGSPLSNLHSILRQGILPRNPQQCETILDNTLAKLGYTRRDIPDWIWKYELISCKYTSGKVHLSALPEYALSNSQAGKEFEGYIYRHITAWKHPRKQNKEHLYRLSYYKPFETKSAIFTVGIPVSAIRELNDLKERIPSVKNHLQTKSDDEAWQWLFSNLQQITVDFVPTNHILSYKIVNYLPKM